MVSKAEVEQQLQSLGTAISDGFQAIADAIATETQQVLDAIAAGSDLTSVSDSITTLQNNLTNAVTAAKEQVDAIVPPTGPTL